MKFHVACCAILLSLLCSNWAYAGSPQWLEVRSPHFTVISDANEKQARHVLDQLERMRWVFQKLYPNANVDPAEPILVLAAKNNKTFQTVEPAAYLGKGQLNLAGYFLRTQDRNYVLLRLDAEEEQHPFATVYHEYTHLQFSSISEWLPLWLNEGTAEFFQNSQIRDKDVLVGQADANDILYLRQQRLIPLPVLFKVDASSPYYHEEQKGSVFYAESWALTHYLQVTDREKGTNRLSDYLQRMSRHEDPVAAAEQSFGNLKQLESALSSYIQNSQYKQFVMNSAAAPIDESSYQTKPLTTVQADAWRAEILAKVQREKEARDLISSILKADPDNAQVRETMGEMEFRAGNREAARNWYKEAAKLNPRSCIASYYFASISMQSGQADDETIEPSLRAAIQECPSFAPTHEALASYLGMHHKNMDEALSLIKTAVKLDPGNFAFRMNAASILVGMGKTDDAIAVLGAAAKLARNPSQVSAAQHEMDELRQFRQRQDEFEQKQREYAAQPPRADGSGEVKVVAVAEAPKHPEDATGPKHTVVGVIQHVSCGYPAVLEFEVQSGGKTYSVYNNNFSKIELTVVGFTPKGSMNPCSDLAGMKARVQYAESSDKTVDGKVFAIELHK
jgi:tetratricopeptide (TPR) repeat protein